MNAEKMASAPYKMWKAKPPGPEQIELDRMFANKEIDATCTPDSVRKINPLFNQFTPKVFAAHFRKAKAKYGFRVSALPVAENSENPIPELGGTSNIVSTRTSNVPSMKVSSTIEFENSPVCTWVYTDHLRKTDFVCIVVPVFAGCRDISFELSEDGTNVTIKYTWPSAIYKAKELFNNQIGKSEISMSHPKVHSFVSHWLDAGITENSVPKGQITVALPFQVKREIGSWEKEAIKINDTRLILLEFTAYQKSLLVNDVDTSINFD